VNILFLTSDFLPNIGGMATHAHELARAHVLNGNTVHLIHPVFGDEADRVENLDGITVHKLFVNSSTPKIKHLYYIRKVRNYILKLMETHPQDILHWHDLTPNCWTTRTLRGKIPLVWTNHSSNYLEYFETAKGKRKIKRYLGHPDAIISPSRELYEKSAATGLPTEWLSYISNGVDASKFKPHISIDVLDKDYGLDVSKPIVICPRRLEPKNGVQYYIQAVPLVLEQLADVQFLIVGGGFPEEKARFEAMLEEAGCRKNVFFTGNVANTSMPKFYSMSTIAVLPSLMEATSISGLEAMATGLPLIGTKVGGIPEIIDDGKTGTLVEPRNPEQLAAAILDLLKNPAGREWLGNNARKRVEEEFSWLIIARKTQEIYTRVLQKYGKA
jgi:glycosyltransferase involved in cell wall biosynthesis